MTTKNRDDDTDIPKGTTTTSNAHDAKYAPVFVSSSSNNNKDNDERREEEKTIIIRFFSAKGIFWSGAIDDEQIHGGKSGHKIHPERKTSGRKRGQVKKKTFFSLSLLLFVVGKCFFVVLFRDKGVPRGVLCGHKILLTNRYSPILYKY